MDRGTGGFSDVLVLHRCWPERQSRSTDLDYVGIYPVQGPIHPQSLLSVAEDTSKCVSGGFTRTAGILHYGNELRCQGSARGWYEGVSYDGAQLQSQKGDRACCEPWQC
ncbi:hypothetical protein LZ31DRAFT_558937 [Colletotrichum somersetense]|nr:hypothetical protein LZ31DRAFT_558937 [Colletotrichum somersetense]